MRVYTKLAQLGSVPVGGQPAEMVARQVRYRLSEKPADREDFRQALHSGSLKMDRATFEFYSDMLRDWGGSDPPPNEVARTEAAIALWTRWKTGDLAARGREIIGNGGRQTLAIWTEGPDHPIVRLLTQSELASMIDPLGRDQQLHVSLTDGPQQEGTIVLTPGETRLPFLLRVSAVGDPLNGNTFASGRSVLITGLFFAFALMSAAAYVLYRVITRQIALAQQQADFVSAVSHEFRTPLTSMRHLTELLAADKVSSEERKKQYYRLLAQESQRLHRMVESLLSFGRMQAGVSHGAWNRPTHANCCGRSSKSSAVTRTRKEEKLNVKPMQTYRRSAPTARHSSGPSRICSTTPANTRNRALPSACRPSVTGIPFTSRSRIKAPASRAKNRRSCLIDLSAATKHVVPARAASASGWRW